MLNLFVDSAGVLILQAYQNQVFANREKITSSVDNYWIILQAVLVVFRGPIILLKRNGTKKR
jgi:hypothetical protein